VQPPFSYGFSIKAPSLLAFSKPSRFVINPRIPNRMTALNKGTWAVTAFVAGCVALAVFTLFFKKSKMSDWAVELNRLHEINLTLFEDAVKRGGTFQGGGNRVYVASAMIGSRRCYYIYFPGKSVARHGEEQVIGVSLLSYDDRGRMVRAAMFSDGSGKLIEESEFFDLLSREVDAGGHGQEGS
jgi:hypothetical protein